MATATPRFTVCGLPDINCTFPRLVEGSCIKGNFDHISKYFKVVYLIPNGDGYKIDISERMNSVTQKWKSV